MVQTVLSLTDFVAKYLLEQLTSTHVTGSFTALKEVLGA